MIVSYNGEKVIHLWNKGKKVKAVRIYLYAKKGDGVALDVEPGIVTMNGSRIIPLLKDGKKVKVVRLHILADKPIAE